MGIPMGKEVLLQLNTVGHVVNGAVERGCAGHVRQLPCACCQHHGGLVVQVMIWQTISNALLVLQMSKHRHFCLNCF